MLKLFFWVLLAANIVLFVFQQTYHDAPSAGKREPERLAYQYQEDRIRQLSADEINREIARAKVAGQDIASPGHCIEIAGFSKSDAARFEQQIPSLSLNAADISMTSSRDGSAFMVFIPPAASQKAAEAKIAELKEKGIDSFFLIKDQSRLRWAISLGVFKTREAAANYAAELEKNGLADLQIIPRGTMTEKRIYRLNNLNEEQTRALETIMEHFPDQSVQHCQPHPPKNPA